VKKVAGLKPERLIKINHVDEDKARAIIAKAKTSVASRDNESTSFLIQSLAEQIREKQVLIAKHKSFLEQNCQGPEVTLLATIPGIGAYSAASIMIDIEDIKRFDNPKSLVWFFGVNPELKESGDKKFVVRMSKKGRATMRATLYMCAMSAVRYDEHMKAIYHRHRGDGMTHKQALGVIMQKLLRVIWGVLTTKTEYNSGIDIKNQKKCTKPTAATKDGEMVEKRRFQETDIDAPISNKQTKKRKVYAESQAPKLETNTGSSSHT
jgi:hypothetical protein